MRGRYLSGLFALTLCPALAVCLNMIFVQFALVDETLAEPEQIMGSLQGPFRLALAGAVASLVALIIYSLAYGWSARRRSG